jgi:predicted small secreted protein
MPDQEVGRALRRYLTERSSFQVTRLRVGESWPFRTVPRRLARLYTLETSFGSGRASAFPIEASTALAGFAEEPHMKRLALSLAIVAGLAVSAAACTPTAGGVGTACQGDAHGIVCK